MKVAAVITVGLALVLTATPATSLEWRGFSPPRRGLATMVVDGTRHRALLFGGGTYGTYLNDVWEMALDTAAGYKWSSVTTSGSPPAGRFGHAAIYDSAGDRMIIFAGMTTGGETNDLWQLDLSTTTWQRITPSGTPPGPRVFVSAVYHPDRHSMLVLDGKYGSSGLDELWELDLDSLSWRQVQVSGTHPTGRWSYGLVLDRDSNSLILFAGQAQSQLVNDVWKLDLTPGNENWTELSPSGNAPAARANFAYCYVPEQRRIRLFAGFTYPPMTFQNDLHTLDLTPPAWSRLYPTGELPVERRCPAGAYDPYNGNFLTFGGEGYDGHLSDGPYIYIGELAVSEWQPVQPNHSSPWLQLASLAKRPVHLRYYVPEAGPATIRIVDASGRVIRTLFSGVTMAGTGVLVWDGKDATGRDEPAGNYFCYLESESSGISRRFVLTD